MNDYTELELKTFELSGGDLNPSLSVTSLALISGLPPFQHSPEELYQLIQSKQLWLISPGLCRIQISVCQHQLFMASNRIDIGFLEHLADAICQCSLWPALGLTIKQEDIQYRPPYDGAPNLYFIVEHPQKSSLLLSPPHSPTARLNGIECLFRYQTNDPGISYSTSERHDISSIGVEDYTPETTLQPENPSPSDIPHEDAMLRNCYGGLMTDTLSNQPQEQWGDAAYLAQMALHVIIGIKKRMRGLRLFQLDSRPSLLEIAPAIWNAHYLKAVTSHVVNFPIISNILATSSRSRSSSLRRKSAKLLIDNAHFEQLQIDQEQEGDINRYRGSIQQKLWGLLQTKLNPTIGIKNTGLSANSWRSEFPNEAFGVTPMEIDELDEFEIDPVRTRDAASNDDIGFGIFLETDHQHWRDKIECLHPGIVYAAEDEAHPKEPDCQSDLNYSDFFSPSSTGESFNESTVHQYARNSTEFNMNADNSLSPNHFHGVETIYSASNESSYSLVRMPRDDVEQEYADAYEGENYYVAWPDKAVMYENHVLGDDMDPQASEMYEY